MRPRFGWSALRVLRTVDSGRTWAQVGPPDTADLQFRDIEAFDAQHAVALSIGEGERATRSDPTIKEERAVTVSVLPRVLP